MILQQDGEGRDESEDAAVSDRMTYNNELKDLIELKKEHPEYRMILPIDDFTVF